MDGLPEAIGTKLLGTATSGNAVALARPSRFRPESSSV